MLSPMTVTETTLLAKDRLESSPWKTAVFEITELLRTTSPLNRLKRVFGRTHSSLAVFPKLMVCPSLGTSEGSTRLISKSKVSVLSLRVPPVGRLTAAAIASNEDTILHKRKEVDRYMHQWHTHMHRYAATQHMVHSTWYTADGTQHMVHRCKNKA